MGLMDTIKDQFIDVIEYIDEDGRTIVTKYTRLGAPPPLLFVYG